MKDSFVLYTKYRKQIAGLTAARKGVLFEAILCYASGEELPKMDALTEYAFRVIQIDMDENAAKYEERCKKNAENARSGKKTEEANASDRKRTQANASDRKPNDNDYDNDLLKEKYIKRKAARKNAFDNFPQREYDYTKLERLVRSS